MLTRRDKIIIGCCSVLIALLIGGIIAVVVVETQRLTYTGSPLFNVQVSPAPLPQGPKTCFPLPQCP